MLLTRLSIGAAVLVSWLACSSVTTRAMPPAVAAPLVTAFAEHGWVFGLHSDGKITRLTAGTRAVSPALSPDRGAVAYFTSNRATAQSGHRLLNGLWRVGTRANRQHLVARLPGVTSASLAWSPDSRYLAFVTSKQIEIWNRKTGYATVITRIQSGLTPGGAIAWSRDSGSIAVPLAQRSTSSLPRGLVIALGSVSGQPVRTIWVGFPPALMGSQTTALGSHPDASQIGWEPDGDLLVATTVNGAGNSLTGIWRVPHAGGVARLLVGTRAGLALRRNDPPLANATHFLVSPNWEHLATDPGKQLWVAGLNGKHGRFLATHQATSCATSQYEWLIGGNGLAYVSLCTVGGSNQFRSTLYTVSLHSGRSRQIAAVTSSDMNALDLAPAFRCVACG